MKLGKKLRAVTAGLLTAALSVGMGAFPGTALETGTGEIAGLQAFLLGNSETGGADYNGDGVVDGMDLTLLRQKAGASGEIQDGYTGFIHADGKQLVDEDGKPYTIKGMAFGNEVWSNPSAEPTRHHDAESYQELAEMGFDSVRFYLNYGLFESDSYLSGRGLCVAGQKHCLGKGGRHPAGAEYALSPGRISVAG